MNGGDPLVKFDTKNRATLVSTFMPAKTRSRSKRKRSSPKLIKGRLSLRVKGYPGVQKLAPSHLVPYLPISKLRSAALQYLRKTRIVKKGGKGKRKRRSKKRRGKKSKK